MIRNVLPIQPTGKWPSLNMDTRTFIERIESEPEIIPFPSVYDETSNTHANKYQGVKGNLVIIDTTEEETDDDDCIDYLLQLGLPHLAYSLFPEGVTPIR